AITPAAGFVAIPQSIVIGVVAALITNMAISYKQRTSLDDTLDVFPCHGLGGIVGMLLTGVFATYAVNPGVVVFNPETGENGQGALYGGNLFLPQLKGMVISVAFSFAVSWILFKFINFIEPLRVSS